MARREVKEHSRELAAYAEWEWNCAQVESFVHERGHCDLGEHPVAEWLRRQHQVFVAGKLSPERQHRLATLGITFDPQDAEWRAKLLRLRDELTSRHVPRKSARKIWLPEPADSDLAAWLREQRVLHGLNLLRADRARKLRALQLIGQRTLPAKEEESLPRASQVAWDIWLQELAAFQRQHGHCRVPKQWSGNPSLFHWVANQRHRQRAGHMPADLFRQLDELGFVWDARNTESDARWEHRFAQLRDFQQQRGHTRVTRSQNPQLAKWREVQRRFRREGILRADRMARLDAIGFEWEEPGREGRPLKEVLASKWEARFAELLAFQQSHGHLQVPAHWVENPRLATWIAEQRKCRKRGKLLAEREQRLQALGFPWRPLTRPMRRPKKPMLGPPVKYVRLWELRYAELAAFQEEHGHINVPSNTARYKQLSAWRYTQRDLYRRGRLSEERIARLDAISFEWENPSFGSKSSQEVWDCQWDAMFQQLVEFHRVHGHTRIAVKSAEIPTLGAWADKQRTRYRAGLLSPDRIARLEALGFVWRPGKGARMPR